MYSLQQAEVEGDRVIGTDVMLCDLLTEFCRTRDMCKASSVSL